MYSPIGSSWNSMRWSYSDMKEPKAKNNQYILEEKGESVSISPISNVKAFYKAIVIKSMVLTEG